MGMPALSHNPDTGFLESGPCGFDSTIKLKLLEMLEDDYGDVEGKCRALGFSHMAFYRHYDADPLFRARCEAAKRLHTERVRSLNRSLAMNPKQVIDRMAYLRAHAPEYRDQRDVNQNVNISLTFGSLDGFENRLKTIEAEVVGESASMSGDGKVAESAST